MSDLSPPCNADSAHSTHHLVSTFAPNRLKSNSIYRSDCTNEGVIHSSNLGIYVRPILQIRKDNAEVFTDHHTAQSTVGLTV